MSGHLFFREGWYGTDDALHNAMRLLAAIGRRGSLTEWRRGLPRTHATPELRLDCPDADKARVADTVAAVWSGLRAEAAAGAPYAWHKSPAELTRQEWAGKLLGWLLTAFATSLGAQFWFRLLSETLKLRAAGRKPAPPPAEEEAAPVATGAVPASGESASPGDGAARSPGTARERGTLPLSAEG